jgi:capsular polysaccharide biosynthesis protein
MNSVQRPDSYEGADYTGVLRRRWWIVLGLTCIGVVGALAYVLVAPKVYTSTASVYVKATGADQSQLANSRTQGTVNLDTEAQLVTSTNVATIAEKQLHSSLNPRQLSREVSVTVPPNSQVLDIACHAPSAKGAAACAQAFAEAYLNNRTSVAASSLKAQLNTLQSRVSSLQNTVSDLKSKISGLPSNSSQRISAQADLSSDQKQLSSLNDQEAALTGQAANTSGGYVITSASPPSKPSSPKKSLILPSGLIAGLLLGLIVAFVVDRRDKRIHGAQDVERQLNLPVMFTLPENSFRHQVSLVSPRSRAGQTFTELGHTVAAALGEGSHVLLVAGASPGPGGSAIAANLAATLARAYSEVVLVCADMNDSVAPEILGLNGGRGLAEVVAGTASVQDVARGPEAVPGLWVLTPGADTSAAYYIQHDMARALTSQLRRDARYVIIEAQAAEGGADTFAFAEFADAALVVAESNRTTRDEVADCARRLEGMRAPVLGVVLAPALGMRVKVRPPRPGRPQAGSRPEATGRSDISALSGTQARPRDRLVRPARSLEGFGDPADRVSGS